jgi:transcription antitermination factor NusG
MNDPMPLSIPSEFIVECRDRERAGEFHVKGGRLALKYRCGDSVPLIRGAFYGMVGKFIQQLNDQIELTVQMFGAERTVRVPVMAVQVP